MLYGATSVAYTPLGNKWWLGSSGSVDVKSTPVDHVNDTLLGPIDEEGGAAIEDNVVVQAETLMKRGQSRLLPDTLENSMMQRNHIPPMCRLLKLGFN